MAYSKREMALVVAMAVLAYMAVAEAAISCGTVSGYLAPCVGYLTTPGVQPNGGCCSGVKSLYSATSNSRPDRVTSCGCIKTLAKALGSKLNSKQVSSLPGTCGVNLGYTISLSTNCNTIP